jgi:hypothetical protein
LSIIKCLRHYELSKMATWIWNFLDSLLKVLPIFLLKSNHVGCKVKESKLFNTSGWWVLGKAYHLLQGVASWNLLEMCYVWVCGWKSFLTNFVLEGCECVGNVSRFPTPLCKPFSMVSSSHTHGYYSIDLHKLRYSCHESLKVFFYVDCANSSRLTNYSSYIHNGFMNCFVEQ